MRRYRLFWFVVAAFLLMPEAWAASLTEAILGNVSVNVSEPEEYTPDDYGDKFMYHRVLTKRGQSYYLDVTQIVRDRVGSWGIFAQFGKERLSLDVKMVELQDHASGYDVDVTMTFRYLLTTADGRKVLETRVQSTGLSTVGEHFDGGDRSKKGLSRAVESNLEKYRQTLQRELPKGLDSLIASATPPPQNAVRPAPAVTSAPQAFPTTPVEVAFKTGPKHPDDIAVVIGNADYRKDIPDVTPAYADAEGFKRYALTVLGVRLGNLIDLRDASQAELVSVFGSPRSHKGKLFNWVRPGVSRVYVYFAGHGAPGNDGSAYLVPVDADPSTLHLNGLKLDLLYANLAKIPAKSITVVLEACFSGASQGGAVISNASPVYLRSKETVIPPNVTVIAAGQSNQLASWERDGKHSLFTTYLLKGLAGDADKPTYGNGNGIVDEGELKRYLDDTMTYFARRYYGRDQTAHIVGTLR